jgi:hypothetical protein
MNFGFKGMENPMSYGKTLFDFAAMSAIAGVLSGCVSTTGTGTGTGGIPAEMRPWMSNDVQAAWKSGYKGQGTTITVVDNYDSAALSGALGSAVQNRPHGDWTSTQAQMIAPETSVRQIDFDTAANSGYSLGSGLNVISNSYSVKGSVSASYNNLAVLERTTVDHARNGTAVVVKSAGNDGRAFDGNSSGQKDVFGTAMIGADSAIFVGALTSNGSPSAKASMAGYSNYAGNSAQVQSQFLVVGVDSAKTGLAGTSFAVPIVSGYAAILGSKFTNASPVQIADQLLNTARTDTVQGYSPAIHGRGEASLSRALAPAALQ